MYSNQTCILLFSALYLQMSWVIGTVTPAVYNPCSALTQSSTAQELERAQHYCRSVHSRAVSAPISGIHDRCPDSINPGCTPERQTGQGTKYICTVDVRSTFISLAILGQSYCRYDLLYCVPDPAFWKLLDKSPWETSDLGKLNENYNTARSTNLWKYADAIVRGFVTDNAAAYGTQGARPVMEDRFKINEDIASSTPKVSFYAVFDGHAGQLAVDYTQNHLWKNLQDKITSVLRMIERDTSKPDHFSAEKQDICLPNDRSYLMKGGKINYGPLLHDVILSTDEALLAAAKETDDISGTTAIMALIDGSRLFIANVGDSRAVMCDSLGNAIQLSIDHKPADEKEQKIIKEAGGYVSCIEGTFRAGGCLATSRALGNLHLKGQKCLTARPDVFSFDLFHHQPQFIILASDGLWDVFSNEEAVAFIAGRIDSDENMGAKGLAIYAYLRGSKDNITVLVINLKKRTWSAFGQIKPSRMSKPLNKTYRKITKEVPRKSESTSING